MCLPFYYKRCTRHQTFGWIYIWTVSCFFQWGYAAQKNFFSNGDRIQSSTREFRALMEISPRGLLRKTYKMKHFAEVVDGWMPLNIFANCSILDVWYDRFWNTPLASQTIYMQKILHVSFEIDKLIIWKNSTELLTKEWPLV